MKSIVIQISILTICIYATVSFAAILNISGGNDHTLLLLDDGSVWAWGANDYGQLGDGTTSESHFPVRVKNSAGTGELWNITAISAGAGFSVALTSDSTIWAWGVNDEGQLGDGSTDERHLPVAVLDSSGYPLDDIVAISAGAYHCLALDKWDEVWAWGANRYGALGRGTADYNPHPLARNVLHSADSVFADVVSIACGSQYNYALRSDQTLWAWGSGGDGQLGNDTTLNQYYPEPVLDSAGTGMFGEIALFDAARHGVLGTTGHGVAIDDDGYLWAWGRNYDGQLGDGTATPRDRPVHVHDASGTGFFGDVASCSNGSENTLALLGDATVWAWGNNYYGSVGDNSTFDRYLPVRVHGIDDIGYLDNIAQIETGQGHAFAIHSDGRLFGWGRNDRGQLGDGSTTLRRYPVEITSVPIFVKEPRPLPEAIRIEAYPNPFNGNCRIMIDDLRMEIDAIEVFDINGRMVERIPPAPLTKGGARRAGGSYKWQPDVSLGSGVYLVRATVGGYEMSRRVVYLK